MTISDRVGGLSTVRTVRKMIPKVSRTGVEPVTDGYLESCYHYSPPLYQLSYHELLILITSLYNTITARNLSNNFTSTNHTLTYHIYWHLQGSSWTTSPPSLI